MIAYKFALVSEDYWIHVIIPVAFTRCSLKLYLNPTNSVQSISEDSKIKGSYILGFNIFCSSSLKLSDQSQPRKQGLTSLMQLCQEFCPRGTKVSLVRLNADDMFHHPVRRLSLYLSFSLFTILTVRCIRL